MTEAATRAAARLRTYLRLCPTNHSLGGEIAYSEEFRSEDWSRSAYAPTRADGELLLAELDRLHGRVTELEAELRIGAPWKCPACGKDNRRDVCVICEQDRPDAEADPA